MRYRYYINDNIVSKAVVCSIAGPTIAEDMTKRAITNYLYNISCRTLSFEYKKGIVVTIEIIPFLYTIRKIMWSFLSHMQLEQYYNSPINYVNLRVKFPSDTTLEKVEKNFYKIEKST